MRERVRRVRRGVGIASGGGVYLMVCVILLIAATYTQANLLFWSFGLMIGGLLVSSAVAAITLSRLSVTRMPTGHAAAGEAVTLRYELENRSVLPVFGVVITELGAAAPGQPRLRDRLLRRRDRHDGAGAGTVAPLGWVLHVGARHATTAAALYWPQARGVLELDRIELSSTFPFGILRKRAVFSQPDRVPVFPTLHRLPAALVRDATARVGEGERRRDRPGLGDEFYGLRDHRPGDPIRAVHWKRSAQLGRLVTRETVQAAPNRLRLGLDLRGADAATPQAGLDGAAAYEAAISLAASIVCEAHLAGCEVGLRIEGAALPGTDPAAGPGPVEVLPERGSVQRTRLLDLLSALPPCPFLEAGDEGAATAATGGRDHLPTLWVRWRCSAGRGAGAGAGAIRELCGSDLARLTRGEAAGSTPPASSDAGRSQGKRAEPGVAA